MDLLSDKKKSTHFWVVIVYQDQMISPFNAKLKLALDHSLIYLYLVLMYSFLPMPCVKWTTFFTNLAWFPQSLYSLLSLLTTELIFSGYCLLIAKLEAFKNRFLVIIVSRLKCEVCLCIYTCYCWGQQDLHTCWGNYDKNTSQWKQTAN